MEWIQRIQAGDGEAFQALYDQYKNLVYRTAFLMLGQAAEAEDALQEVFLKVYRSLGSYDPRKGAFSTWLYRITANHCINVHRAAEPEPLPIEAAEGDLPVEVALDVDSLESALDALSTRLRAVIVLRYYADLSYAEIGEALDLPLGTVKSRLNAALEALRRGLRGPSAEVSPARREEVRS